MCAGNDCIQWINALTETIFDNESSFMDTCWRYGKDYKNSSELIEFYFSGESCRIAVILECGTTVSDTVDTVDVLAWYDENAKHIPVRKEADPLLHVKKKVHTPKKVKTLDLCKPDTFEYVADRIRKLRPSSRDKALNSIASIFHLKGGISEQDKEDLFSKLLEKDVIAIAGDGLITYM